MRVFRVNLLSSITRVLHLTSPHRSVLRRQQERELYWLCHHANVDEEVTHGVRKTVRLKMKRSDGGKESRGGGTSRFSSFISNIVKVKRLSSAMAPQENKSRQPRAERGSMVTVTHVGDDVEDSIRLAAFMRKVSAPDATGAENRGRSVSNASQMFRVAREVDGVVR